MRIPGEWYWVAGMGPMQYVKNTGDCAHFKTLANFGFTSREERISDAITPLEKVHDHMDLVMRAIGRLKPLSDRAKKLIDSTATRKITLGAIFDALCEPVKKENEDLIVEFGAIAQGGYHFYPAHRYVRWYETPGEIHLTLTGSQAGRILCGAPKLETNEHTHAMYFYDWNNPRLCPKCKAEWDAAI